MMEWNSNCYDRRQLERHCSPEADFVARFTPSAKSAITISIRFIC